MLINAYCTLRDPPALSFPHALQGRRDRASPELEAHLRAFSGFVMGGGQRPMTAVRYHVLSHLERVNHHLSVHVEAEQMDDFSRWARAANAIVFLPDSTVRSPEGLVLVHPHTGDADPSAEVPYPPDALRRKEATDEVLSGLGVAVPRSLPPVVSELELVARTAPEVAARSLALFACALRAESLASGQPIATAELRQRLPRGFEAMSPRERDFIAADAPPRQAIVDQVWRYEALAALAWAVGLIARPPFPRAICDVSALAEALLAVEPDDFIGTAQLRPASELLDELDLQFRLHWAVTDARQRSSSPPAGLEPGAVRERHLALNWLTRFQGAEWDDVDTPT